MVLLADIFKVFDSFMSEFATLVLQRAAASETLAAALLQERLGQRGKTTLRGVCTDPGILNIDRRMRTGGPDTLHYFCFLTCVMFCDTAKRWREIDGENLGTRRGQGRLDCVYSGDDRRFDGRHQACGS